MAREWLYIQTESAYNTPTASPTVGTNAFYVRLDGGNAFTMRPRPVMVAVPYGGGLAIDAFRVSDKTECKGKLTTKVYAGAYSQFLVQWAAQLINAGQTIPWTTTEPPGDLASCWICHAIQRSDGTYVKRSYSGAKVDGYTFQVDENGTIASLSLDISASTPSAVGSPPATAAPTDAQMPSGPYVFTHASGGLVIASSRTQFQSIQISGRNTLARRFWANQFIQLLRLTGRSHTLQALNYYLASPNDRTGYEALTVQTPATFTISNGTHSIAWNFETNSVFTSVEDQLPLNDLYLQTLTVQNQYDSTNNADLALTFT